jgi:hypothetical protein
LVLRAFAKREDVGIAGSESVIDDDTAIDREPGPACKLHLRLDAGRADHKIGGKDAPAGQFESRGAGHADNPRCVGPE